MITYKTLRVWEKLQPGDEYLREGQWNEIIDEWVFFNCSVRDLLDEMGSNEARRKIKKKRIG